VARITNDTLNTRLSSHAHTHLRNTGLNWESPCRAPTVSPASPDMAWEEEAEQGRRAAVLVVAQSTKSSMSTGQAPCGS